MFDDIQAKPPMLYEVSLPKAFEAQLYCFELALMSKEVVRKKLNIVQNVVNTTLGGMLFHLVQKV